MTKVWINNKFVDIKKAAIPLSDRGFLYGDGVFETMRSYSGTVFRLDEHIERLLSALVSLRIRKPYGKKYFKDIICKTLRINGLKDAYIRISVTRGQGRFGINYTDIFIPNTVILARNFDGYPSWMHKKGISVGISEITQNENSPVSGIKSLNFLNYIMARIEARERGFDDAVLKNTKGDIAEGATSNIFLVKGNNLATPSINSGVLPGITRSAVIKIALKLKFVVKQKRVSPRELMSADEVFFTNSLAEVLPVTYIDSRKVGAGAPGPVTRTIHNEYQKEVIRETLYCKPIRIL